MYFNLAISMFLCGVWHGAKWTFIIWGSFHGLLLIWERTMGRQPIYRGLPGPARVVITNIIVMFGWVVFRAPSLDQAVRYWGAMIGISNPSIASGLLSADLFATRHAVEMLICAVLVWQPLQAHEWVNRMNVGKGVVVVLLFLLAIVSMFTNAFSPFLYFQF
jgi:alginate O-acetyltransferase complex protein AlgI